MNAHDPVTWFAYSIAALIVIVGIVIAVAGHGTPIAFVMIAVAAVAVLARESNRRHRR